MTTHENEYRRLLRCTLITITLCIGAVLICYFWIDRPVAFFVYRHHINTARVFRWLTYPPPEVQNWSALVLTILMVRRACGPFLRWQKVLVVACLSLIVADDFRISLGDVFGRYWPETWTHDNPSLIGTGTYGFHPFQRGDDIGSFPSGHACRILGFAMVWLIAMRRNRTVRVVTVIVCAPMLVSLVAMNYHFVSDVIAGSVLGALIATYAAHLARLPVQGILMWRNLSNLRVWTAELRNVRHKIAVFVVAFLWAAAVDLGARGESKDWIVLNNCHLIANPANDGDSFHVRVGAREYIFRLYLVDAPETDELTPARLVQQAKYFGISVPQAIEVGRAATEFTRQKLSEPFTVFTHMTDAMGRSRIERLYAFVQTREGDLGEQLIRNGLARNYGFKAVPPGLKNSRLEIEKLQQYEDAARQERIGGWGVNAGRLNVRASGVGGFSVFSSGKTVRPHAVPLPNLSPALSAIPAPAPSKAIGTKRSHAKEAPELGKIDINTATEKELKSVPGIGHVIAARIIAARPFRSADDLKKVNGIGDRNYAKMRPYFQ